MYGKGDHKFLEKNNNKKNREDKFHNKSWKGYDCTITERTNEREAINILVFHGCIKYKLANIQRELYNNITAWCANENNTATENSEVL